MQTPTISFHHACRAAALVAVICWHPSPADAQSPPDRRLQIDARDRELWEEHVTPYLADSLWATDSRYDAAHLLMVPLHSAFAHGEVGWQKQFVNHFASFLSANRPDAFPIGDELGWLQYTYLATQFLVLAANSQGGMPETLADSIGRQLAALWTVRPAWQWDRPPFRGVKERLRWKLQATRVAKTYHRAVIDHEQYVFAIAADLARYERISGTHHSWSSAVVDILNVARAAHIQRVVWQPDGGWLFQPGVWADHPDFRYAGQPQKVPGMKPAPLRDVAEDASHSFRRPLWLQSLLHAAQDSAEADFYGRLLIGLERQFRTHVLIQPGPDFPAYRTTNWMDGRNGVFRWQYKQRGATWGYGPYELSASFTLGWWAFLDTDRIRLAYADQASRYPLPLHVLRTYGYNSRADDSEKASARARESFRELLVRLASKL